MNKNTVEIKPNKVVKTFHSRTCYVREVQVYEKLHGSGLAPEMTSNWDGAIEHNYVTGQDFSKVLSASMGKPLEFVKLCKTFCDWYKTFREKINMALGKTSFSDFIYNDGRIYGIDFEDCKPGNVEDDIASFASQIALMEGSYTLLGIENAKIFIRCAWERFRMSSSKLYANIKKNMEALCNEKNVAVVDGINEYLATFVCCSFVHAPKKDISVPKISEVLYHNKQMWTVFANDVTGASEKLLTYLMTSEKENYEVLYLTKDGEYVQYPILFRTEGASLSLQILKMNNKDLKDIILHKLNSKALPMENLG